MRKWNRRKPASEQVCITESVTDHKFEVTLFLKLKSQSFPHLRVNKLRVFTKPAFWNRPLYYEASSTYPGYLASLNLTLAVQITRTTKLVINQLSQPGVFLPSYKHIHVKETGYEMKRWYQIPAENQQKVIFNEVKCKWQPVITQQNKKM